MIEKKFADVVAEAFDVNNKDKQFDGFVFVKGNSQNKEGKTEVTSAVCCDAATLFDGIMFIVQKAGVDVEDFDMMLLMMAKDKKIKEGLMNLVNDSESQDSEKESREAEKKCECEKKCKSTKESALKMAILASILGGEEDEKSDEADELESLLKSIFS